MSSSSAAIKLLVHPTKIGGPGDPLPPVFFFSKTSSGNALFRTLKILVVIWSDRASRIFRLADFEIYDFASPSTPIRFITNSPILAGGYSITCAMDRRIIATLEHNKYLWLCSNVAKFLISVPPPLISHARGKKSSFFALQRRDEELIIPPHLFVPPQPPPPIIPSLLLRFCS